MVQEDPFRGQQIVGRLFSRKWLASPTQSSSTASNCSVLGSQSVWFGLVCLSQDDKPRRNRGPRVPISIFQVISPVHVQKHEDSIIQACHGLAWEGSSSNYDERIGVEKEIGRKPKSMVDGICMIPSRDESGSSFFPSQADSC